MALSYSRFVDPVAALWTQIFDADFPLFYAIKEQLRADYPLQVPVGRAIQRGEVSPSTEFAECVANARSYAIPHLKQLAQVLDHPSSREIRRALESDREILVVDVGCAAGILGLFVDRAGFQRYWGIDTNPWMLHLAKATSRTTKTAMMSGLDLGLGGIETYGGAVERRLYRHLDSVDGIARFPESAFTDGAHRWGDFVNKFLKSGCPRQTTVLLVLNHVLFQPVGVTETITQLLEDGRMISRTGRAEVFLISIEPRGLWKPDRLGAKGLRRALRAPHPPKWMHEFMVTGAGEFLSGKGTQADVTTAAI